MDTHLGVDVNPYLWHMRGMVPYSRFLSDLDRYNPVNVFGTEEEGGFPAGIKRPYADPSQTARLISYLTGIKTYETDRDEGRGKWHETQQRRISKKAKQAIDAEARGNKPLADRYWAEHAALVEEIQTAP